MKTTQNDLESVISRLNDIAGTPTEAYSLTEDGYKPNANCYHLESAYGGWQLAKMSSTPGGTGVSHPLAGGYGTKRECYTRIQCFISGMLNCPQIHTTN
jgi:hypothetical protein